VTQDENGTVRVYRENEEVFSFDNSNIYDNNINDYRHFLVIKTSNVVGGNREYKYIGPVEPFELRKERRMYSFFVPDGDELQFVPGNDGRTAAVTARAIYFLPLQRSITSEAWAKLSPEITKTSEYVPYLLKHGSSFG